MTRIVVLSSSHAKKSCLRRGHSKRHDPKRKHSEGKHCKRTKRNHAETDKRELKGLST
jgi:hypothetical protein